jgi:SAM-dependent methyltransferase
MTSSAGQKTDPSGWETLELFANAPAFNRWLFDRISTFCKGEVLEVGSGIGNISGLLMDKQPKISLSDLRIEYCQFLEKKFAANPHLRGVYQIDLSLPDFDSRYPELLYRFDTVIALNVVEHIEQDLRAVQNAKKLLRNEGKLIILVPAGPCLYNTFDRELGHYRRYTKTSVSGLLATARLTQIHANYFNFGGILGWWFSGSVLKKKIIPRSQLKLYNQLVPFFRMIDQLVGQTAGLSVIAVATNQST